MTRRPVAPVVAGTLGFGPMAGRIRPYTTRAEYVKHARLLWHTARQFARLGDTVLAPDYFNRARGLMASARLLEA